MWTQIDLTSAEYEHVTYLLKETAFINREFSDLLFSNGNLILDKVVGDERSTPHKIAFSPDLFETINGVLPELKTYARKEIPAPVKADINTHGWGKLYGSDASYNAIRGAEDETLPRPKK